MAGLGQSDTQGSHNAGKLLLRIKQGLECSQLKQYLKHDKTPVLAVGADPPCWGWREGFGEHLEQFVPPRVPRGTSTAGVACPV